LDPILRKWGFEAVERKNTVSIVSSVPALSDSQWITSCSLTFI
jgi:hypothetical protein